MVTFQGIFDKADSLYIRAIEITEKTLGSDHPDLALRINNRAGLLRAQVRFVRIFEKYIVLLIVLYGFMRNNPALLLDSQVNAVRIFQDFLWCPIDVVGAYRQVVVEKCSSASLDSSVSRAQPYRPVYLIPGQVGRGGATL